ncbi:MAG: 23S rRNA (guanosine(2251)-2'-O)-methyltransferase RlmB [Sarcina sp.]
MTKSENKMRQMRKYEKQQQAFEKKARYEARKQAREEAMQKTKEEYTNVEKVSNREDLVEGRNAVIELLKSDRTVEQIFIASGKIEGSIKKIIGLAKDKDVVLKEVDRKKLDSMSETGSHQGVIAQITPFKYSTVEDILEFAKSKNEKPFIVILDELEDPHNLGSIVRTAELSGVHGIIIPKRRNVGVTGTVYKASVGAIEYMKIAKVTNINAELDKLKEEGIWIYGADINGEDYSYNTDFSGACALIIGNEGKGMSALTKKKCDKLVKIPMIGKINSLNASVAGGIMMYEIMKSRINK